MTFRAMVTSCDIAHDGAQVMGRGADPLRCNEMLNDESQGRLGLLPEPRILEKARSRGESPGLLSVSALDLCSPATPRCWRGSETWTLGFACPLEPTSVLDGQFHKPLSQPC